MLRLIRVKNVRLRTHVVSKAQVEFLQDKQVPAEQRPGHGHVTDGLTDHRHGGAAAVQLRQADPGAQTCRTQRSVINNNNNNNTTSTNSSSAGRQTHQAGPAPLRPARRLSPGPSPSSAPSWLSSGYGRPAACSESPRSRYRCRRSDAGETITMKERKKDRKICT